MTSTLIAGPGEEPVTLAEAKAFCRVDGSDEDALVSALIAAPARTEGGLPLLQFALAELWEARDPQRGVIPASALEAMGGVAGALGRLLAIVGAAQDEGTWARLKACLADDCQWAYYDLSRNRSAVWCDMKVCGNREKVRSYRERHHRPRVLQN